MPTHRRSQHSSGYYPATHHNTHPLVPTQPWHPAPEPAAFRDLLVFEERLKQAAARYARRKRKYQTLLTFLLAATVTSAYNAAAASPQWSGILDLALRWAADSDTDYRSSGLSGAASASAAAAAAAASASASAAAAAANRPKARFRSASAVKHVVWEKGSAGSSSGSSISTTTTASATVDAPLISPSAHASTPGFFAAAAARRRSSSNSRASSSSSSSSSNDGRSRSTSSSPAPPPSASDEALPPHSKSHSNPDHASAHADGAAMLKYYLWVGLFLFFSTTTFLFFASGLYSERIASGATFVPQANRALRHYNLYLNTRTGAAPSSAAPQAHTASEKVGGDPAAGVRPSLRKAASWIWWYADPVPPPPASEKPRGRRPGPSVGGGGSGSESDGGDPLVARLLPGSRTKRPPKQGTVLTNSTAAAVAEQQPPPSTNPRGELLLGPRVSTDFRHGYERYRAEFERRRAMRLEAVRKGHGYGWRAWRAVRSALGLGAGG